MNSLFFACQRLYCGYHLNSSCITKNSLSALFKGRAYCTNKENEKLKATQQKLLKFFDEKSQAQQTLSLNRELFTSVYRQHREDFFDEVRLCRKLLTHPGVHPNHTNRNNSSLLYLAAEANCSDLVHLFLNYGANASEANNCDLLPLTMAVLHQNKTLVKALAPKTMTENPRAVQLLKLTAQSFLDKQVHQGDKTIYRKALKINKILQKYGLFGF